MFRGMEGKADPNRAILVVRIAWLTTFVVPLILAGLLLAVKTAHAAPGGGAIVPLALEEGFELDEEGEIEEEECGAAEEELEEGELEEAEVEDICEEAEDAGRKRTTGSAAPEECLLRSAHARAVASPQRNRLKLTVGYTTYEPVSATVEIREGSARLGSIRRHLGRSGVLRVVESLGSDPSKPRQIVVQIRIPPAPDYCAKFRQLVLFFRGLVSLPFILSRAFHSRFFLAMLLQP